METTVLKTVTRRRCSRCDGSGRVHDTAVNIVTLGLHSLWECIDDDVKPACPRCGGKGFIEEITITTSKED